MSETDIDSRLFDKQTVYIENEGIYILKGRLPGTGTWYFSAEKYASHHDAVEAIMTLLQEAREKAAELCLGQTRQVGHHGVGKETGKPASGPEECY